MFNYELANIQRNIAIYQILHIIQLNTINIPLSLNI